MTGTLYLVATPIGNLEDITLRAIRILNESSIVLAEDTRNSKKLFVAHKIASKLVSYNDFSSQKKISSIIPNLEEHIDHKEVGTPKTHKKFLGRYEGSYGPIPSQKLLGLLPMPFNTTKIKNLYCVGDSCFPGQGLNAVAFSGYACAHKIGSKLNINSFNLPD